MESATDFICSSKAVIERLSRISKFVIDTAEYSSGSNHAHNYFKSAFAHSTHPILKLPTRLLPGNLLFFAIKVTLLRWECLLTCENS